MAESGRIKNNETLKLKSKLEYLEKALSESEERYQSLIKQSSDGVYIFDPKTGRILEVNNQFLQMIGYTVEEMLGLTMYDIVTLDKSTIDMNIENVIKNREYVFGLRQYLCKGGHIIDVEISSTLISYGDSHVIMVNVRNDTERLKSEKELQKHVR